MAITVKHTKVSTIPDGDDTSVVRPSDWNADHQLVGTVPVANGGTGASTLTGYVKGSGTSTMTASSTIPNTDITGLGTASTKDAGVANGVATLDSSGQVPLSQIPPLGDLNYQGTWNATTNTPTLTSSVGTKGYYYVVSVAGTTNLNGITDWQINDWAVFNGSVWQKIDNTDSVTSVNGYTGTVVLTQTDISGTVPTSRTITAGTGLSGGGDLSANRTLAIANTGVTATTYGSASSVPVVTVNAQGQITSATSTTIAIANTAVSGLGTMSTQNANSVAITGGNIDGTTIGATTPAVITGSTINANTKVVSPDYYAQSILGGNLRTSGGTSLVNWDGGGSGNVTVNGGLIVDPSNKNINMSPTGTGSVTINPATTGAMDNMVIGATTPKAITGTTITATTFSGSGASLTSIPNSALNNSSITINGNATALGGSVSVGTVTSVAATAGTGISVTGSPITSSGTLTITNTAPDQTVAIASGTGISVTGTYPNFTVTNTSPSSGGTVTSVSATAPVVSSGGNTPTISMAAATTSVSGYLTSTDWNTFNNKQPAGSYLTAVTADAPLTGAGTSASHLSIPAATTSVNGYLTSTDWNTFNGKQPAGTYVNTVSGTTNQITAATVSGAVTLSLPTSVTTGQFIANQTVSGSSTKGAFAYGTLGYSDSNHLATFQTAVNAYAQVEIQNTQAGTAASADMVVGNDLTTATTYYGDFGINSSLFSGTGSLGLANATYLTATTGDLSLGTTTSNAIHFVIGGSATDAMTISTAGNVTVTNTLTATKYVGISGGTF